MLGGFDPRSREMFIHRRRRSALTLAVIITVGLAWLSWLVAPPPADKTIEVSLEPEIEDFSVDEDEPELEPEPAPPPPPDTRVEVVAKPKPKPKPKPPRKKVDGGAEETGDEKTVEVGPAGGTPGGTGTADKPKPAAPKPRVQTKPAPPKPKPEPKAKAKPRLDPTQPVDRPENATAPKAKSGNKVPVYPAELKDKGITGSVLVKLHVHRDGSVRGAKILRKKNNATTEQDKARADKLFLKAVIAAIKTWHYQPAKLAGEPITVWHKVNIPFSLTMGD